MLCNEAVTNPQLDIESAKRRFKDISDVVDICENNNINASKKYQKCSKMVKQCANGIAKNENNIIKKAIGYGETKHLPTLLTNFEPHILDMHLKIKEIKSRYPKLSRYEILE